MPDALATAEALAAITNPAYQARFRDAIRMLRAGVPREEIRERHGGVVLRDAEAAVGKRRGR